jgi:hypothetical protein
MTTYRELIYMVLDLIKGNSDDFSYTDEHIAYLLDKYRAFLLKQRYANDPKKHVPYSNYQTVSIELTSVDFNLTTCGYISDYKIPNMLHIGIPRITTDKYYNTAIEYVNRERFPFVGNNKYLKNIDYCTINEEGYLLFKPSSKNNDEIKTIKLTGIFENPKEVLSNKFMVNDESYFKDIFDQNFPIEETLITSLIDLVANTLLNASYRPEDSTNNSSDDMANLAGFIARNLKKGYQKVTDE